MTIPAQDHFTDRWLTGDPIYLTDLDRCEPADALSNEAIRGHWRTLEYATDYLAGVMLLVGPETAAPEIRYPLAASGLHAISVGLYTQPGVTMRLLIRLTDDPAFANLVIPQLEAGWTTHSAESEQIYETFWKIADLSEQEIVLRQVIWRQTPGDAPGALLGLDAAVAYIKLVPLNEAEDAAHRADLARTDTRRLFAHNDAHGPHWMYRLTEAEGTRREIECYRGTDFGRIYWEAGSGDQMNYPTKIGDIPTGETIQDFGRQGDRYVAESRRIFRDKGIDPLAVAIESAHEFGLELHASYRVAGFMNPPPLADWHPPTSFWHRHPGLRGVDRAGNPTPRMAYSYPQTREFALSLLREIAAYPVDGVCMFYNRRLPLVEYEPPLVEGFLAEFGEDPREIDTNDPRWLSFRARVLTGFMRDLRRAMDEAGQAQGRAKRIEVSAIVMGVDRENIQHGIDARSWIEEGLIDTVIPYSSHPRWGSNLESWTETSDVDYWVNLTRGSACRLALNVMPRHMSSEQYRRRAAALYAAGVENFYFWDTSPYHPGSWEGLRRLGHADEAHAWVEAGEPDLAPSSMPIRRLGQWRFDAYGTGE